MGFRVWGSRCLEAVPSRKDLRCGYVFVSTRVQDVELVGRKLGNRRPKP